MPKIQRPGVRDLVLRAAADPKFAATLVENPDELAQHYNLSDEQLQNIRTLADQGLLDAVKRPGGGAGGRAKSGYY